MYHGWGVSVPLHDRGRKAQMIQDPDQAVQRRLPARGPGVTGHIAAHQPPTPVPARLLPGAGGVGVGASQVPDEGTGEISIQAVGRSWNGYGPVAPGGPPRGATAGRLPRHQSGRGQSLEMGPHRASMQAAVPRDLGRSQPRCPGSDQLQDCGPARRGERAMLRGVRRRWCPLVGVHSHNLTVLVLKITWPGCGLALSWRHRLRRR